MERSANLRMAALASVVALAAVLPLAAAVAGPAVTKLARHGDGPREHVNTAPERASLTRVTPSSPPSPSGPASASPAPPASALDEPTALLGLPPLPGTGEAGGTERAASCGPALGSPGGVHAQTCVLRQGGTTWARSYYRNETGDPLRMILTLMEPGGRALQVHCEVAAADGGGTCETPRRSAERATGEEPYSAVAEVASGDGARMLLRSGSNTGAAP